MKVSVICIGDELLKGATLNTNLHFWGRELAAVGILPQSSLTVPDRKEPILKALDYCMEDADLVITTGGLGPTSDDVTKNIIAERFGRRLVLSEEAAQNIRDRWARIGRACTSQDKVMVQAMVPEGAGILHNSHGTAPGILLEDTVGGVKKRVLMLPGPPSELTPMFRNQALPAIIKMRERVVHTALFHIAGMPESIVEEMVVPLLEKRPDISVAYCASPGVVRLFYNSLDGASVAEISGETRRMFGKRLLEDGCETVPQELVSILKKKGMRLALAESCTGGMIAAALTDIAGASDVFPGSFVTYSNKAKEKFLGVRHETLEDCGAVSKECAMEMLEGVMEQFDADAGIAVTGIAGPGGATPTKPVGRVYAAAGAGDKRRVVEFNFAGNREQVRTRACSAALNLLRNILLGIENA